MLYGVETGIDIKKIIEISKYVEEVSGFKLAQNKPVVGIANFTRESGIGVDCLFNDPLAMFATNPAYYGKEASLVMGKKSGLTSINVKLAQNNISISEDGKKQLLKEIKQMGIDRKALIPDDEFIELAKKYK